MNVCVKIFEAHIHLDISNFDAVDPLRYLLEKPHHYLFDGGVHGVNASLVFPYYHLHVTQQEIDLFLQFRK